MRALLRTLTLCLLGVTAMVLATCAPRKSLLEQVDTLGTLRVATVNSAATYYLDADGPAGFEYDLMRAFADSLGLKLDIEVVDDRRAILDAVASGRADLGVGLAVSDARRRHMRFTPPYRESHFEAVYRAQKHKPDSLSALSGRLTLPADTALADWLRANHPDVAFDVDSDANTEELMDRVASGELDATIAGAPLVARNQRYYPNLRVAFKLPGVRQRLAWAFADGPDDGLYNEAIAFLENVKQDGRLHVLSDRYFGHVERLGFVGGREFKRQVDRRLGRWRGYFKRAGKRYDLDWRLLAAIGYQESHWDKNAVSPTTVRGIMMLTQVTAEEMNVDNRRDPQQSIDGGARYFIEMRERLPEEIEEPDRTWFALAAYNAGYGHVMDARRLLAARDRDPNLWVNLRDALPWLTQERYLSETKYGYARGLEAAAYVGNIRAYYDILVWMTDKQENAKVPETLQTERRPQGMTLDDDPDISIESPAF